MTSETERFPFANGRSVPAVGLGTYAPQNGEAEVSTAVLAAVKAGYRHIDCAAVYGNEKAVGAALRELFVTGVVKREDLFITSKLWNTCHRPDQVLPTLKKTLEDLGLQYLDLYLIHWPMGYQESPEPFPADENGKPLYSDVDYLDTWKAMETCVGMGKIKDIGLSNFNSKQIQRVLDGGKIAPAVLQVEINCHMNNKKLIEFCKSKGLAVVAFAPLGTPSMHEKKLIDEPIVREVAKAHKKSCGQVLLRFVIQLGVAVIPKSANPSRIAENIQIFDFRLTDGEMARLSSLHNGHRGYSFAEDHKYFPFSEEF